MCVCVLTEQGSGGEQNINDTTLGQPNSQGGYGRYQQQEPYQPWGQSPPQPTEGSGIMSPQSDALSKPTEPPAPQTQRTPEEEAYWAEMSNKKVRKGEDGYGLCLIVCL